MKQETFKVRIVYPDRHWLSCPLCGAADQHAPGCALEGKYHVPHVDHPFYSDFIDWVATLKMHGLGCEAIGVPPAGTSTVVRPLVD